MNKYSKERNRENYIKDKLGPRSQSTKTGFGCSIRSLDKFCNVQYNVNDFDALISDVLKMDTDQREESVVSVLQEWVNMLAETKEFVTIKGEFSRINKYLKYYKIRGDFAEDIVFPQNIQEEKYAISIDEIQKILEPAKPKHRCYYLCLISSGARPIEIIGLRKKDFFWTGKRYGALIPARLTKKKIARTAFFSAECTFQLRRLLEKSKDEQTIFTNNPNLTNARTAADITLLRSLERIGLFYPFETTGRSKINLYCFRGYFFTKAIRIFNEDIAHAMIGHGAYQQVYQRRNQSEKEELYDELESELLIFDQTKNKEKIKKLQEANTRIADLEQDNKDKNTRLSRLENLLLNDKIHKTN